MNDYWNREIPLTVETESVRFSWYRVARRLGIENRARISADGVELPSRFSSINFDLLAHNSTVEEKQAILDMFSELLLCLTSGDNTPVRLAAVAEPITDEGRDTCGLSKGR